jgi:hydrophobe/amphiphile efflux-1 (HAE1) family protein
MQWLANISVRRPVFATVLILFLCVLGVAGYVRLGVDRFPKVDIPAVVVLTRLPGANPREVETEVTEKIEEAVNTIAGIDEMNSVTSEGVSQVVIGFVLEKDVDTAAQEVREKVATVIPLLPRTIEQPVVMKFDPDATPVLILSLNAEGAGMREITEVADKQVRPLLENLQGVGQVTIIGGRERQLHIWLDPVRLKSAGLTAVDVQRAVASQNLTMPGGALETGPERISVRFQGRVARPEQLADLIVKQEGGHAIRVGDVARVEDGEEEAQTYASRDGAPAVALSIRKQSGTNSVAMADAVKERMEQVQKSLPQGYRLEVLRDMTGPTRTAVHAVQEHLILGGIFAALVVLLFLGNWRSTIIAALAIPTSIVGTFALMKYMDFSLNTITLLALALAVGIVIDDAIVVLENIFKHIHEKGEKPFPAAVKATKEIGLAVLATTLSLIAVFLPVAFMGGIPGRFLASFGWTMAFSIAVSLLVSFTLTPMLAARWLKAPKAGHAHEKPFLERLTDKVYLPIERLYVRGLEWVMDHRWVVVVATVATLGSCVPLVAAVPKGFLPKSDEAQLSINVRAPEGTSIQSTQILADRVAREVRQLPEVKLTLTTIGDNNDRSPNVASIFVKLVDPHERELSQDQMMNRIRTDITSKLPKDLRVQVSEVPLFGGGGSTAAVQFAVRGTDFDQLTGYAQQLLAKLKAMPGAVDADSNLVLGKPEVSVSVDRDRAADLGVNVSDVATTLQLALGGMQVSSYEEKGFQYEVRVRAEAAYRDGLDKLALLNVPSRNGPVPLLNVVKVDRGEGPSQINRTNRQRSVVLMANTAPGVGQGAIIAGLEQAAKEMNMPAGYSATPVGMSKEMGRMLTNFGLAFLLAFIFMYLILAAQFESWIHPLTILISLPLTVPFALLSVLIFRQQLDMYAMLGILVLFGVVKKNSILQVDHTNQLREAGLDRRQAIILGSKDRLRPILMTTIAFVAGMVPLLTSSGIGSAMNRAIAGVVVGGQSLSLVLTLLATPVVYSLFDDAALGLKRLFRLKAADPHETGEAELGLGQPSEAAHGHPAPQADAGLRASA